MPSLSRLRQYLMPLAFTLFALGIDAVRFLRLCLCSRTALTAEDLFLRKQLALYQARHVTLQRPTNATRFTLLWLSHWLDWWQALRVVQPVTFTRWRRQKFQLIWRRKSKPGRTPIPSETYALRPAMSTRVYLS